MEAAMVATTSNGVEKINYGIGIPCYHPQSRDIGIESLSVTFYSKEGKWECQDLPHNFILVPYYAIARKILFIVSNLLFIGLSVNRM